jgi:hypothetical protein
MMHLLDDVFLPIRSGGHGFQNATEMREGAYVASLLQCGATMQNCVPDLNERAEHGQYTKSVGEAIDLMAQWKAQGLKALEDIEPKTIFTQSRPGMQKKINREIMQRRQEKMESRIPTCVTVGYQKPSASDIATRAQRLANCHSTSNAWMTVNPAFYANKMNDIDYSDACQLRFAELPLMGSGKYCPCGEELDSQGAHLANCKATKIRAADRNALHSVIAKTTRRFIETSGDRNGKHFVEPGEPKIQEFFPPKDPNDANYRGDIAINSTAMGEGITIIDVTTVGTTGNTVMEKIGGPTKYKPGMAAKEGEKFKTTHYASKFDLSDQGQGEDPVTMSTICLETTGPAGPETEDVFRQLAAIRAGGNTNNAEGPATPGEEAMALRQLKQQISVSLQSWRARTMRKMRDRYALDHAPALPYVPGHNTPIPTLPPLRYIGLPANRDRTLAVPLPVLPT